MQIKQILVALFAATVVTAGYTYPTCSNDTQCKKKEICCVTLVGLSYHFMRRNLSYAYSSYTVVQGRRSWFLHDTFAMCRHVEPAILVRGVRFEYELVTRKYQHLLHCIDSYDSCQLFPRIQPYIRNLMNEVLPIAR